MSLHRLISVVGIVALCIVFALPAFAQWDPGVEGYAQFRYEYSDATEDGDFDSRRVRLGWRDDINDVGTSARVQIDVGNLLQGEGQDVELKDAWVAHQFTDTWSIRFGFGDVYFGHDVSYSSSKRLPFERSMAARSFLPGERALGLLATYEGPEDTPVQLDLQLFDGMDAWHDEALFDDAESFVARVQYPIVDSGLLGASFMTSNIDLATQTGGDIESDVWGIHALYDYQNIGFRGEYFDGDWASFGVDAASAVDADGWFAEVSYTPENSAVTPFYRYDEFNYSWDMTAAQDSTDAETSRHTFGVAYEPWANNRLTLQVEDIDMETDDDTTVGVQWQISYK